MTKEERIEEILSLTLRDFKKTYKSLKQCAEELGYEDSSWVRIKSRKLKLGISSLELGFFAGGSSTIYLSPEEQEILKDYMQEKQRAGRKPKKEEESLLDL